MQAIKYFRLAIQGITAVLLFGIAFVASGAEQMMRALPAVQSTAAPTAVPVTKPPGPPIRPMSLGPAGVPASGMKQPQTNAGLAPDIVIDGGITIGGKLVPLNGATPVSISSTNCSLPFQFPLKNIGNKGLSNFTISMKMKSEQNQSLVYDGPLGGLSLAPGAIYKETHNGSGLNLVSGTTYLLTVDTDFEHAMRKDVSRGHVYSVRFTPNCGPTPSPIPGGTPGMRPTQRPPGQSMGGGMRMGSALTPGAQSSEPSPIHPQGGGLRMGSALRPATQPPAQPPQGHGVAKHSTLAHAEPQPSRGGAALLNPDAACGSDNTPRISSINGTTHGFDIQPGQKLSIVGCGFGRNGQAYLSGGGTTIELKIDSWKDSTVVAHVDAALSGVRDFDATKVNVKPNGAAVLGSIETNKFRAARVDSVVALPPELGNYSPIYGAVNRRLSLDKKSTRVERDGNGTCGAIDTQEKNMQDSWTVNFLADGFEVQGVTYYNKTNQGTSYSTGKQTGTRSLEGSAGRATWDPSTKTVSVVFQGNHEKLVGSSGGGVGADDVDRCTSLYFVSLNVSGPRGFSPMKP